MMTILLFVLAATALVLVIGVIMEMGMNGPYL